MLIILFLRTLFAIHGLPILTSVWTSRGHAMDVRFGTTGDKFGHLWSDPDIYKTLLMSLGRPGDVRP